MLNRIVIANLHATSHIQDRCHSFKNKISSKSRQLRKTVIIHQTINRLLHFQSQPTMKKNLLLKFNYPFKAIFPMVILFLIILLNSCSKKEVNCSGNEEQKIYFELLSQDFEKIYDRDKENENPDFIYNLPFKDVKQSFFKNAVKLKGMRPTKIEKELKRCECETTLTFNYPDNYVEYASSTISKFYEINPEKMAEETSWDNVEYNLQLTEDGQIYCETNNTKILNGIFTDYAFISNLANNLKNNSKSKEDSKLQNSPQFERGKTYNFVTASEDCSYEINFVLAPKGNGVTGAHIQECYNDQGEGARNFKGTYEDGIIYANIDNKEFFQLEFNDNSMYYYLIKIVYDDGKELKFSNSREDPLIYERK